MSNKPIKTVTVPLDEPVTVEGVTYNELTFRRMKAKDAMVGEGIDNEVRAGYALFAALAGVELAVIEELDIDDFERIGKEVMPLMGKSAAKMGKTAKAKAAAAASTSAI